MDENMAGVKVMASLRIQFESQPSSLGSALKTAVHFQTDVGKQLEARTHTHTHDSCSQCLLFFFLKIQKEKSVKF